MIDQFRRSARGSCAQLLVSKMSVTLKDRVVEPKALIELRV